MQPKVSVIIPVYNVEKYLKEALDSVVNQTLKDIEIICVDDCSLDNCPEILDEYASKDSRVKVIHLEENGGAGRARNIALNIAKGEYIMLLDADDWYSHYACELAYNKIKQNDNDLAFFGMCIYNQNQKKRVVDDSRLSAFISQIDNPKINLLELEKPFLKTVETVYKIYNREFLNKYNIRFSTETLGEDIIFCIKSLLYAKDISVLNLPLYNYRIHNEGSKNKSCLSYSQNILTRKAAYEVILESDNSEVFLKSFLPYWINSTIYWYNTYTKVDKSISRAFYEQVRELFINLDRNHDIEKIKGDINYNRYKQFIKYDYNRYKFNQFAKQVFSITNNSTHKIITILNCKFCIKRG